MNNHLLLSLLSLLLFLLKMVSQDLNGDGHWVAAGDHYWRRLLLLLVLLLHLKLFYLLHIVVSHFGSLGGRGFPAANNLPLSTRTG